MNPDLVAVVKPGEVLALGFQRNLTMAEFDAIQAGLKPFKDRGIEVVIISAVQHMIVTQSVDNPVDNALTSVSATEASNASAEA